MSSPPNTPPEAAAEPWPADRGAPGPGGLTADWPKKAADVVDLVVDTIHDKFIRPVLIAARAIVFGLLIATLLLVLLILLSVALIRLLDVYVFPGRVWASYLLVGVLFCGAGLYAWYQRSASEAKAIGS